MDYSVELTVPAQLSMMVVVRMATAGVLAQTGTTLDVMDDVKLSVEEACLYLINQNAGFDLLKMAFARTDDQLLIAIRGIGGCGVRDVCAEPHAMAVLRSVLESMVDGVELTEEAGALTEAVLTLNARPLT